MTIQIKTTKHIDPNLYDALTVDCFDTIFHRQFCDPIDLFDYIAGENNFSRAVKETGQRIKNDWNTGSHETKIQEFTEQRSRDDEKRLELKYGFRSPSVIDLIERFRAANKPVFVVSNTYYPASELRAFLKGLDVVIYASCDHGINKQNGLLKLVHEENNLAGKRVLHVGDDPEADFKTAIELGYPAMAYKGYQTEVLELLDDLKKTAIEEFHKAPILDIKPALVDKVFSNDVQMFGYSLVGPIVSHFLYNIYHQSNGRLTTFIGRDMKTLHDLYKGKKQYLELNRLQVWQASLYDETDIESVYIYTGGKIPTDVLSHINFKFHEYNLGKYGDDFAQFFKDNTAEILSRSAAKRIELLKYLETLNFNNPFFVDVGYSGTINRRLTHILEKEFNVKGSRSLFLLAHQASDVKGVLKFTNPYLVNRILEGVALFESLIKDPVGPLAGYKDGKAVYDNYEWDEIQQLITNHTRYGMAVYLEEVGFKQHESAELYLTHLCLHPPLCLAMVRNELGLGSQIHSKMSVKI